MACGVARRYYEFIKWTWFVSIGNDVFRLITDCKIMRSVVFVRPPVCFL